MYDHLIYASGIYGVLLVEWRLRCETPLAVRNGTNITYQIKDKNKSRGKDISFHWREPKEGREEDNQVTGLYYGYEILDNKVTAYHYIPPSSVRGALRSWTINHLVSPIYRDKTYPPSSDDPGKTEEYLSAIQEALANKDSGYHWIASIFGTAFDTRSDSDDLSNAGRLRIETKRFSNAEPQPISVNGEIEDGVAGPINAQRQMTVRNPVDHVTHATREGGLHHFLEFCKGEMFSLNLSLLNPQVGDIGLVSLWRRELNTGMLRLGALSSIGRGRVFIEEEIYQMWLGPEAPEIEGLSNFQVNNNVQVDDVMSGLWKPYQLSKEKLDDFLTYL